jgi:hypothetical protein
MISVAVRWYLRYGLSYRDVEELLAERGITVDHVTVYRWVQRLTQDATTATVATPSTAPAVDLPIKCSVVVIVHYQEPYPAKTRRSGCIGYLVTQGG